jgi:hypothetical protein
VAIIDWPSGKDWDAATWQPDIDLSEAVHTGFYSGLRTRRSNLADRMRGVWVLPPCNAAVAGLREGLITHLRSTGDWVRFGVPHRKTPIGTARGTMTASASAAAGARTLVIAGTAAGATLLAGDFLGTGGNLLEVGYSSPTAAANGSGIITITLAMPLPKAVTGGAAIVWDAPTGVWELDGDVMPLEYNRPVIQSGIAIPFRQVVQ